MTMGERALLAIDPGSSESGWVSFIGTAILSFDKESNERLLARMRDIEVWLPRSTVVIEWTAPRGMPASEQLFETLWWAGRFTEAARPLRVERLQRAKVKLHLCNSARATDTNVHAALIDRYGGIGGKEAAVGRKASPGPLYGISRDMWQALAVGVTYLDDPELVEPQLIFRAE